MLRVFTHLGLALMLLVSTPIAALCSVRCLTTPLEAPPASHCHKGETDPGAPDRSSHDSGTCLCAIEAPRIGSRIAALAEMPILLAALVPHPVALPGPDPAGTNARILTPPGRGAPFEQRNPPLLL